MCLIDQFLRAPGTQGEHPGRWTVTAQQGDGKELRTEIEQMQNETERQTRR